MGRARNLARLNATDVAAAIERETILPVGTISYFPNSAIPTGWLSANGQAVSRTTYAALFAEIGTTYGAGNGNAHNNMQPFMSVNMCIYAGA